MADRIVEPKFTSPPVESNQADAYAELLGLAGQDAQAAAEAVGEPERFGHMGVAIVGGMIWPGWSRSREVFQIEPYSPSKITGADILRGQELAAEHGW